MNLKEITDLCKAGKAEEAYTESHRILSASPDDRYARLGVAYSIKALLSRAAADLNADRFIALLEEYAALDLDQIEEIEMNNKIAWDVRAMILAWNESGSFPIDKVDALAEAVKKIEFLKPHRYYSVILDAFLKVKDEKKQPWCGLPTFVAWWGLYNLLPEDYDRVLTLNGIRMASLAERAYTACLKSLASEVKEGRQTDAAESFLADMDVLEETHPEYDNIHYQKSSLLKNMGRDEEALKSAITFVKKRPNEFRAWAALGDILTDNAQKAWCYCRALNCKIDASFQGKVRYSLAVAMFQMHEYEHAKREFEKIVQIYESRGWHLPAGLDGIMQQDWYVNTAAAPTNRNLYADYGRRAEEILYMDVEELPILISTYNPQKQIATFVTADRRRGFFSTKKTTYKFIPNNVYMVKFDGGPKTEGISTLLRYRRAEDQAAYNDIFFRKDVAEVGLRPGQSFQFVNDIYIDGSLLRNIPEGTRAEINSALYYNIKRESWGWKAISVKPIN